MDCKQCNNTGVCKSHDPFIGWSHWYCTRCMTNCVECNGVGSIRQDLDSWGKFCTACGGKGVVFKTNRMRDRSKRAARPALEGNHQHLSCSWCTLGG